jgi:hypothetical protein
MPTNTESIIHQVRFSENPNNKLMRPRLEAAHYAENSDHRCGSFHDSDCSNTAIAAAVYSVVRHALGQA